MWRSGRRPRPKTCRMRRLPASRKRSLISRGAEHVIKAVRKCIASLFTNRAISYRVDKGFDHFKIALSAGVQKMVRSDLAASGVMFSIDTESGFKNAVLINSIYGLGENIVQGNVNPDEFYVFKPTLAIIVPFARDESACAWSITTNPDKTG